jgi:hypothetical protein
MTSKQANRFLSDIRLGLSESDYCQTIYISIRGVGTRSFTNACCQSLEGWLFIFTKDESFCVLEKDLGDFVCADITTMPTYTFYNERTAV